MKWYWKENQKKDIENFLQEVNSKTYEGESYIGCVRAGELCFDLLVREDENYNYRLCADLYVSGIDTGYGFSYTKKPYDYFSEFGCVWKITKFLGMNYKKFTKFIETALTYEVKSVREGYASDGKKYNILEKANKELIEW